MHTVDDQTTRIISIVAKSLEVEPGEIAETDRLIEDHDADSLALIGVLAALEQEFRVTIAQDQLSRMTDVRGIRAVLADAAGW